MLMKEPAHQFRIEPRWPVALAIVAVLLLLVVLPGRVRVFPAWVPYVIALVVLAPMIAPRLTGAQPRWLRVERWTTVLFFLVGWGGNLAGLAYLILAMVKRPADITGLQLSASSVAVWVTNVLMFSLLYWQIDRGGPEGRMNDASARPDWLFPQAGAGEDPPPGWKPDVRPEL